ncbi:MAG: hypothetical protein ACRD23_14810 [Terriglobales bacterium]
MTLLDAKEYDPGPARRRKIKIVAALALIILLAAVVWMNRYRPEKHVVDKFFAALMNKDYDTAYGIYFADPQWKEHPAKYSRYPLNQFIQDWGEGGQWGIIRNYKVNGASTCSSGASGVVVDVIVNGRAEHAQLWVEKSDNTLSPPPCELLFR